MHCLLKRLTNFYGQDEDAHRAEIEKLNNFPELRMILNPGGCAFYEFPVADDQLYMFVQPAAKKGQYHQDYCDKVRATPVSGNRFDSVSTSRLPSYRFYQTALFAGGQAKLGCIKSVV